MDNYRRFFVKAIANTVKNMLDNDKSYQRARKRAEREAKPLNRNREKQRRLRQIEKGMLKVD